MIDRTQGILSILAILTLFNTAVAIYVLVLTGTMSSNNKTIIFKGDIKAGVCDSLVQARITSLFEANSSYNVYNDELVLKYMGEQCADYSLSYYTGQSQPYI
ncbi:hypothetical protein DM01DRAFT_1338160 [Hesseltinella vesiculosa]|uniref:Uncharacterized protein n=1 Tax=Hesseltinella vesiculosa TaxID=101127 RepID=A0A1X2GAZ9_9FUNG|nr:hypothetical protein DM01DRAFT_1338160 [Hesseltinella vesiculosa]